MEGDEPKVDHFCGVDVADEPLKFCRVLIKQIISCQGTASAPPRIVTRIVVAKFLAILEVNIKLRREESLTNSLVRFLKTELL